MNKLSLYQADKSDAVWVKSSFSADREGCCVELAQLDGGIAVRDSQDTTRPALCYTREELAAFVAGVKAGEFDRFL